MRKLSAFALLALVLAGCMTSPGSLRAGSASIQTTPAPTVAALLAVQATASSLPTFTPTVAPLVLAVRTGETWNMRQYPGELSEIITVLAGGTRCEVRERGEWILARCGQYVGWVNAAAFVPGEVTP